MFSLSIIFCRALTLIGCVCAAVAAPELSPGETKTENSGCIKISCKIVDGKVFFRQWKKVNIIYLITPCSDCKGVWDLPRNSPDCGEENIKLEQTGCCKICISCKDHSNNVRKVGETWNNRKWVETTGWMEDKCSTCTCQCSQYWIFYALYINVVKGTEDQCCPHYICMPEALPLIKGAPVQQCPHITEPECGSFQEVKSITGPDNCPRYVCGNYCCMFQFHLHPLLFLRMCTNLPHNKTYRAKAWWGICDLHYRLLSHASQDMQERELSQAGRMWRLFGNSAGPDY